MINLDIYSNELNFIKKIRKPFKILRLFTENKRIFEKRNEQKFKIYLINRFNQLFGLKYKKPELAISYGFSLIFNKKIISEYKKEFGTFILEIYQNIEAGTLLLLHF